MISIIIPTYKRNEDLQLCLNALEPQLKDDDEIIVSDDFNSDKTNDLVSSYPRAYWKKGPSKGPAANRNNGARNAKGDWLIFIDDDCIPDEGLISEYKKAISTFSNKVFEGRIYAGRAKEHYDEESPVNEYGGRLWSCNFCIKKELFDHIGGFDEGFPFPAMEDVDLHYRLIKQRVDIKFLKEASVLHPWRKHSGTPIIRKRQQSIEYYLKKHPELLSKYNLKYQLVTFKKILNEMLFLGVFKLNFKAVLFYLNKFFLHLILFKNIQKWKQVKA